MVVSRVDPHWREKLEPESDVITYGSQSHSAAASQSGADGVNALHFLTALASDLSKGPVELPCFPDVVIKIRDALNDPSTSMDGAVKLVGSEPRLAARLIQTANSAALNPSGKRVADLRTAITRLGQKLVQGTAMAFALQQVKQQPAMKSIAKTLTELWKTSIAIASICQVVSRKSSLPAEEAFIAGLMHGIGLLYIMAHGAGRVNSEDASYAELIESWHPGIGKAVLENWRFPEVISNAVGDQDDVERHAKGPAELVDILIVSKILAQFLNEAPGSSAASVASIGSFSALHLDVNDCNDIIRYAKLQLESLQDSLGC